MRKSILNEKIISIPDWDYNSSSKYKNNEFYMGPYTKREWDWIKKNGTKLYLEAKAQYIKEQKNNEDPMISIMKDQGFGFPILSPPITEEQTKGLVPKDRALDCNVNSWDFYAIRNLLKEKECNPEDPTLWKKALVKIREEVNKEIKKEKNKGKGAIARMLDKIDYNTK